MHHFLKHMSLRLWIALLVGWLTALTVIPMMSISFGSGGALAMVIIFFVALFILYGWIANYAGWSMINRMIREAESWEMAGSLDEAEKLLRKSVAIFDSFLLSPLARRRYADRLVDRLARFYLAWRTESAFADIVAMDFLKRKPDDAEVAESWLEHILDGEVISKRHQRMVDLIVHSQPDNKRIREFAARIFLKYGRTDFTALNTYRRVWRDMAWDEDIVPLTELLLKKQIASDWALEVYAEAARLHPEDRRLTGAIAAGARQIERTVESRAPRSRPEHLMADRPKADIRHMGDEIDATGDMEMPPTAGKPSWRQGIQTVWAGAVSGFGFLAAATGNAGDRAKEILSGGARNFSRLIVAAGRYRHSRRIVAWMLSAAFLLVIILLFGNTVNHLLQKRRHDVQPPAEPQQAQVETEIIRFTVQTAAYSKPEHARRYVDLLKSKGVDAYIVESKDSQQRMLFQVRISRFTDKQAAREYAERLKKDGIIEDYYVANYIQP